MFTNRLTDRTLQNIAKLRLQKACTKAVILKLITEHKFNLFLSQSP